MDERLGGAHEHTTGANPPPCAAHSYTTKQQLQRRVPSGPIHAQQRLAWCTPGSTHEPSPKTEWNVRMRAWVRGSLSRGAAHSELLPRTCRDCTTCGEGRWAVGGSATASPSLVCRCTPSHAVRAALRPSKIVPGLNCPPTTHHQHGIQLQHQVRPQRQDGQRRYAGQ